MTSMRSSKNFLDNSFGYTLPETNIEPARKSSQKEKNLPKIFRCYVSFRVIISMICLPSMIHGWKIFIWMLDPKDGRYLRQKNSLCVAAEIRPTSMAKSSMNLLGFPGNDPQLCRIGSGTPLAASWGS